MASYGRKKKTYRYNRFGFRHHGGNMPLQLTLIYILCCCCFISTLALESSGDNANYDDYVKEVLEENQEYYSDHDQYDDGRATNNGKDTEENKEEEEEKQRRAAKEEREELKRRAAAAFEEEEERKIREKSDRIRRQREEKFQKELEKMSAMERKNAEKKKKSDAKIAKQVLDSSKKGNHYAVLGLRNLEMIISSRTINIPFLHQWIPKEYIKYCQIKVPEMTLFHISSSQIRKSFRIRALSVHPDKSCAGRAEEAFIAVENSASLLSNKQSRNEYDQEIRRFNKQRKKQLMHTINIALDSILESTKQFTKFVRTILGPFAFPVLLLGAILI